MTDKISRMQEKINNRQNLLDAREDHIANLVIQKETPKHKPTKEEKLQQKDKVPG